MSENSNTEPLFKTSAYLGVFHALENKEISYKDVPEYFRMRSAAGLPFSVHSEAVRFIDSLLSNSGVPTLRSKLAKAFLADRPIDPVSLNSVGEREIAAGFYKEIAEGRNQTAKDIRTCASEFEEAKVLVSRRRRAAKILREEETRQRGRNQTPISRKIDAFLCVVVLDFRRNGHVPTLPSNEVAAEPECGTDLLDSAHLWIRRCAAAVKKGVNLCTSRVTDKDEIAAVLLSLTRRSLTERMRKILKAGV